MCDRVKHSRLSFNLCFCDHCKDKTVGLSFEHQRVPDIFVKDVYGRGSCKIVLENCLQRKVY